MANLSALEPFTTKATALAGLVLVTPQSTTGYQPQNPPSSDNTEQTLQQQPATLMFHYEGEQTVLIESDITDHYVETNIAVQDQIALRPETITTHGFIGELNDVTPSFLSIVKTAADKLTTVVAFQPELTTTAEIVYSEAFFAYQLAATVLNTAVAAWDSLTGQGGESVINGQGLTPQANQNKQQSTFQQFYGYWRKRTLFTVQTPWAVFQDMAIKSLRAIQDAETRMITDFEVTFKMIRTASTQVSQNSVSNTFQGRSASQSSGLDDLGTSSPPASTSLADGIASMA